ncbi:hypothetical protein [Castellaniella denitrificans]|uniref:hypothetical protein n=1 Tax=Castellaniella denitrificans TaxID=56119 RepID=UPI00361F4056
MSDQATVVLIGGDRNGEHVTVAAPPKSYIRMARPPCGGMNHDVDTYSLQVLALNDERRFFYVLDGTPEADVINVATAHWYEASRDWMPDYPE